jgi:hypothetical protein
MKTRQALVVAALVAVLAIWLAPLAWSAIGTHGYFYRGRCVCGNEVFVRIQGDGYFSYSPGHSVPEHRALKLRAREGGWEVLRLPNSDLYSFPMEREDKVAARVRFRDGTLYEAWGSSTNWTRLPRAYNIWRV